MLWSVVRGVEEQEDNEVDVGMEDQPYGIYAGLSIRDFSTLRAESLELQLLRSL